MPVTTRSSVAGNVGWDHCKKGNIACVYSYLASNRLVLEGGPRLQLYPPLKCRSLRDSYHSWLSGVVSPQWALVHWERSEGWYSLLSGRAIAEAVPIQTHVLPLLRVYNDVGNFGTAITGQETRAPGCDSVRRFSWAAPSIGGLIVFDWYCSLIGILVLRATCDGLRESAGPGPPPPPPPRVVGGVWGWAVAGGGAVVVRATCGG